MKAKWVLAIVSLSVVFAACSSPKPVTQGTASKPDVGTDVEATDTAATEVANTGDAGSAGDGGVVDVQVADTAKADTGIPDVGTKDTGGIDTGGIDTGGIDTGGVDSGPAQGDTAKVDTQVVDAGTPDAGASDSGAPDTHTPDASTPDTTAPDTGTTDTGTTDTSITDAGPALPAGLGNSPCSLPGEMPVAGNIELTDPFPNLSKTFGSLTFLTHPHDGTDRIVVVERKGVVWAFDNKPNVSQKTKILDISPKVSTISEGGLLSIAFHPKFASTGRLFLSYTSYIGGKFTSVFSEISVDPKTLIAKLPSEKILLTIPQPYANHDGGQILFDQSGMLVIGMGDGGSAGDPLNAGQNSSSLLGAVLRIDVDNIPAGKKYGIPSDNPKKKGWAPENWAIGLRNPWRMSIDRLTGVLWAGDVGQNKWEEVTLVPKGGNLGWRVMEGTHCYKPNPCNKKGYVMPVFEYGHTVGQSITGGYVYRGKQHPSLQGMYIFGDYVSRRYWAVWQESGQYKSKVLLSKSSFSPASFGEDRDGEIYVLTLFGSQKIARIQPKKSSISGTKPPSQLSKTGCFANLKTLQPAKGVVPYGVQAPLWSDGAAKARFVVPPTKSGGGPAPAVMPKSDDLPLDFPQGTILIKHFGLGSGAPGTSKSTPVETRFMVLGKHGWVFWTYSWNVQGTDATLQEGGTTKSYTVGGGFSKQTWQQPAQTACMQCHTTTNTAAPLGLTPEQLGGKWTYENGQSLNQLQTWTAGGLLTGSIGNVVPFAKQPWPNVLSKSQRNQHARTYLDVNCAVCHKPGGSAQTNMDLRYSTALSQTKACDVAPGFGNGGVGNAKLITPGKPGSSVVFSRMSAKPDGAWFMPHIGVTQPDAAAIALIKKWIEQLSSCK
ncbi:MAG: PQQ-dependent sugar dehydrogenase [Myxococcales bacterium]|nr:PQQ-dependent sugar dehydrogenase [Myxococcales bacterium]